MEPTDPRTDEALLAAANAGDVAAFAALYRRYRDWVARLALRFTGNQADALDVLQETFLYLLRKFPGFRLSARLTTFLYPVVRNLALAIRRKQGRIVSDDELLAAQPAPSVAEDPTTRADLAAVVASLPLPQREALLMRFVDDMELAEIATALAIPVGTVKSRLHNALAALREDPRTREYFLEE
jgi:RNA polymerase sigma-70 factor (ECF subfamily)